MVKTTIELEHHHVERSEEAAAYIASLSGLSKTKAKDAMKKGAVWLDSGKGSKRLRRASAQLVPGSKLSLYYSENILNTEPPTATIIDDASAYSVWNKPAGLMSGGSRYGDHCAINRVVEKQLDRPTFLVHRLDRFVWGVMLLAHSKKAATELSRQFQSRETEKTYKALVHGLIKEEQTIDLPVEGKVALSSITPLSRSEHHTLVEVAIETGRKHQIRQHLSAIGHPIVGDRQHSSADPNGIQLASVALGFKNLEGKFVRYELPEELHPKLLNEC